MEKHTRLTWIINKSWEKFGKGLTQAHKMKASRLILSVQLVTTQSDPEGKENFAVCCWEQETLFFYRGWVGGWGGGGGTWRIHVQVVMGGGGRGLWKSWGWDLKTAKQPWHGLHRSWSNLGSRNRTPASLGWGWGGSRGGGIEQDKHTTPLLVRGAAAHDQIHS